jgi:hypothetical protein
MTCGHDHAEAAQGFAERHGHQDLYGLRHYLYETEG